MKGPFVRLSFSFLLPFKLRKHGLDEFMIKVLKKITWTTKLKKIHQWIDDQLVTAEKQGKAQMALLPEFFHIFTKPKFSQWKIAYLKRPLSTLVQNKIFICTRNLNRMFVAIFNILCFLSLWDLYHMTILIWYIVNLGYGYETQDVLYNVLFALFMVIYFTYLVF